MVQGSRVSYGDTEGNPATWDADKLFGCYCDGSLDYTKMNPTGDVGYYVDALCKKRKRLHGLWRSCCFLVVYVVAYGQVHVPSATIHLLRLACQPQRRNPSSVPYPLVRCTGLQFSVVFVALLCACSGSFTLSFRNQVTAAILASANSAALVAALNALGRSWVVLCCLLVVFHPAFILPSCCLVLQCWHSVRARSCKHMFCGRHK